MPPRADSAARRPPICGTGSTTENTEAYQLYLKGRDLWNARGLDVNKALHYFELALLEDPNYALAYTGLADTYHMRPWTSGSRSLRC